jgi:hypothetical protein
MEGWNPFGWSLLVGGFLFGVIVGGPQAGDKLWLISYTAMLAGLTILLTNLIRTLWRESQRRKLISNRLINGWQTERALLRSSNVSKRKSNAPRPRSKALFVLASSIVLWVGIYFAVSSAV